MITEGVDPVPDKPSNVASRYVIDRGDIEKGFAEAVCDSGAGIRNPTGPPGATSSPHAVVADVGEDGKGHRLLLLPGPFHGAGPTPPSCSDGSRPG